MLNTGHSITCLHHLYQPTPVCHMFMLLSQTEFISFSAASNFHVNSFFRFFISFIFVFTRTWLCYIRVRAIANPSVCLSVTFMHPTQRVETFRSISLPFGTLAIIFW